ncbi:ROK family protein [Psychrobacillus sp. L3]|uniref:ROK family protein n=1 Tax=Psychrobacillus sp. L3 TaxID=3236891 RepID=UPI0036F24519
MMKHPGRTIKRRQHSSALLSKKTIQKFITIKTGFRETVVINKQFLPNTRYQEMGLGTLIRDPSDTMESNCPFHPNCFEGLASGTAIEIGYYTKAINLPADHPAWEKKANYIAQGVYQMMLAQSHDRIIIGEGVMKQTQLLPKIKQNIKALLNG